MKKNIPLLLFVLASTFLIGQDVDDLPLTKTILFEINSPNSNKTSYLFGTHHAFGKLFFDSLEGANQALAACDLLILESTMIPGRTAEDIINSRQTITNWEKFLNKKDLAFITNLFASSPTDYRKLTPTEMHVFLNRHFKQEVCLSKSSEDTSLTLDGYIGSVAKEQKKSLLALETSEDQIAMINKDVEGMPRKVHKRRLARIIELIRSENSDYCEETDWYSDMKIDLKLKEPCGNSLMLTDRNSKWMVIVREKLESNTCFIAVGLSHLMYECGLITQLRELGYTISPKEVGETRTDNGE